MSLDITPLSQNPLASAIRDTINQIIAAAGTGGVIESLVAGDGIEIDNTDPAHPVVSAPNAIVAISDFVVTKTVGAGGDLEDIDAAVEWATKNFGTGLLLELLEDQTSANTIFAFPTWYAVGFISNGKKLPAGSYLSANIVSFLDPVAFTGAATIRLFHLSVNDDSPADIVISCDGSNDIQCFNAQIKDGYGIQATGNVRLFLSNITVGDSFGTTSTDGTLWLEYSKVANAEADELYVGVASAITRTYKPRDNAGSSAAITMLANTSIETVDLSNVSAGGIYILFWVFGNARVGSLSNYAGKYVNFGSTPNWAGTGAGYFNLPGWDSLTFTLRSNIPGAGQANNGVEVYCTETRCYFRSNGTGWIQTSIGEFTDTEMRALTIANFGLTIYNSTYQVNCKFDGTRWIASSPFLIKSANAVATVTNTTSLTLCDSTQIPTWIMGRGWMITHSFSSSASTAGNCYRTVRIDESPSGTGGTTFYAVSSSTGQSTYKQFVSTGPTRVTAPGGTGSSLSGSVQTESVIYTRTSSTSPLYLKTLFQMDTNPAITYLNDLYIYAYPGI